MYAYHAAEHMAVHAYEAKLPLIEENVVKFPAAHPRCGTSFLMTVVLVSIIMFMILPRDPFWFLILSRIILVPIIAGISYELIRYAGTHDGSIFVRIFNSPNILLQNLTTRQPDDSMMEVAITAIDYAIAMDAGRAQPSDELSVLSTEPYVSDTEPPEEINTS